MRKHDFFPIQPLLSDPVHKYVTFKVLDMDQTWSLKFLKGFFIKMYISSTCTEMGETTS